MLQLREETCTRFRILEIQGSVRILAFASASLARRWESLHPAPRNCFPL